MARINDLEKIKMEKHKLESKLAQLIYKFNKKTGHLVVGITISNESSEYSGDFMPTYLGVALEEVRSRGLDYYELYPGFRGHSTVFKNKEIKP